MASWEQKTLAESGIVDNITNTAAAAAETVTDLATQVQTIAEAAKNISWCNSRPNWTGNTSSCTTTPEYVE